MRNTISAYPEVTYRQHPDNDFLHVRVELAYCDEYPQCAMDAALSKHFRSHPEEVASSHARPGITEMPQSVCIAAMEVVLSRALFAIRGADLAAAIERIREPLSRTSESAGTLAGVGARFGSGALEDAMCASDEGITTDFGVISWMSWDEVLAGPEVVPSLLSGLGMLTAPLAGLVVIGGIGRGLSFENAMQSECNAPSSWFHEEDRGARIHVAPHIDPDSRDLLLYCGVSSEKRMPSRREIGVDLDKLQWPAMDRKMH